MSRAESRAWFMGLKWAESRIQAGESLYDILCQADQAFDRTTFDIGAEDYVFHLTNVYARAKPYQRLLVPGRRA